MHANKKSLKNIAGLLGDEILALSCGLKYIQWYHTVVYDLTCLICSKIFNINNYESELYVGLFLVDPKILLCNCDKSPFFDKNHGLT